MGLLRKIRRKATMTTFLGTAPTPAHAEEREAMETRFVKLATEAGVRRDFARFRQEVLCRYLSGKRHGDKLERWAEDVFLFREEEAEARAQLRQPVLSDEERAERLNATFDEMLKAGA